MTSEQAARVGARVAERLLETLGSDYEIRPAVQKGDRFWKVHHRDYPDGYVGGFWYDSDEDQWLRLACVGTKKHGGFVVAPADIWEAVRRAVSRELRRELV